MTVSAKEKTTGLKGSISISNDWNRLTKEEIERMVADAERYRLDELKHRERTQAKSALETFVLTVKEDVQRKKEKALRVLQKCSEIMEWLDEDDQQAIKEDFEKRKKEVETLLEGGALIREVSNAGNGDNSLFDPSPSRKKSRTACRSVHYSRENK